MSNWAAVYLIKRAGYSEKAFNELANMLGRSWKRNDPARTVALSRALAAAAFRKNKVVAGVNLPSTPHPVVEGGITTAGSSAFPITGWPGHPDVSGRIQYRFLPKQPITFGKNPVMGLPAELELVQTHGEGGGRIFRSQADLISLLEQMGQRQGTPFMPFAKPGRTMPDPKTGYRTWDALPMWARAPVRLGGFTHWYGKLPGAQRDVFHELNSAMRHQLVEDAKRMNYGGTFLRLPPGVPTKKLIPPEELMEFS